MPGLVERENGGKRELGSIGTAGENRPALDRSTAQPLLRSPFPARLFGSNLNNSPIKGSLAFPGGRASLPGDLRVEPVGYPTSSPTDPDERLSRIRFLRETVLLRRPSDIS